jgi:hypothetical protein
MRGLAARPYDREDADLTCDFDWAFLPGLWVVCGAAHAAPCNTHTASSAITKPFTEFSSPKLRKGSRRSNNFHENTGLSSTFQAVFQHPSLCSTRARCFNGRIRET